MYKHRLLVLLIGLSFIACNSSTETSEIKKTVTAEVEEFNIDGKYASNDGDIEFTSSKDGTNTHFTLLVVDSNAHTGEADGDFTLEDANTAEYKAENCRLHFKFTKSNVIVEQDGTCEMGLNVSASGTYKKS